MQILDDFGGDNSLLEQYRVTFRELQHTARKLGELKKREQAGALRKRELIKLRVLENSGWTAREAADAVAEQTGADVVQVIGSRFVLFKRNEKEPVIENIPKADK